METKTATDGSRPQNGPAIYQARPEQPLSEAIIEAIAAEHEIDALELADEFGPLYDVIDPSALDSLFQSTGETSRTAGCVTFVYADYRVEVDQTGRVELADRQ
ncbi:HalOD1 output domain-containing protein [Haloarchaeobius amylolyticus]|uniref:HalOD1 output domain-containing protein n=1 Tax=Haloarchaeobius amylolyticus TaxID=1198296 RepID=A0ABD6BD45_9EURY